MPSLLRRLRVTRSPQQERRAAIRAHEAEACAQVMVRDGETCWLCGTNQRPTCQHCDPRGMGGTSELVSPAALIVLCGSGTTGCHGLVESEGRHQHVAGTLLDRSDDGWAYDLGYLIRTTAGVEPRDVLRWHHAYRVWYELTDGGVRVPRPEVIAPPLLLLDHLDGLLGARAPRRTGPVRRAR